MGPLVRAELLEEFWEADAWQLPGVTRDTVSLKVLPAVPAALRDKFVQRRISESGSIRAHTCKNRTTSLLRTDAGTPETDTQRL